MKFNTSISKIVPGDHIIRGQALSALIAESSFAESIYLLLKGGKPSATQAVIFQAALVSVIDHGMGTASSMAARFVASGGNSVNASVAAGVIALGDYHGGAIEKAMKQFAGIVSAKEFVAKALQEKTTMYGFGHKIYKDADPRVGQLLQVCARESFTSPFIDLALAVETEIASQKGKKIPLNIDGLIAGILLELGFTPKQGKVFFIIARTPGLVAQVLEELQTEEPVRRIDEEEITYTGSLPNRSNP